MYTKWKRISFYTQPHQTSTTIICRLISKYRGLSCDLDSCVERLQGQDNSFDNFFRKRLVRPVLIGIIKGTQSVHKLICSLSGCPSGKNSSLSMAPFETDTENSIPLLSHLFPKLGRVLRWNGCDRLSDSSTGRSSLLPEFHQLIVNLHMN